MSTKQYFNVQPFNNATAELEPLQLRTIGYYYNHRTGNYTLTYTDRQFAPYTKFYRQQLVALPAFFVRVVPEVKADVVAGCTEVTPAQFRELGFIVRETKGGVGHAVTA